MVYTQEENQQKLSLKMHRCWGYKKTFKSAVINMFK